MFKDIFKVSKRKDYTSKSKADVPEDLLSRCPECKKAIFTKEIIKNAKVCPECQHHFIMGARERINFLVDKGTFNEHEIDMVSVDPLDFPEYKQKIAQDQENTKLNDAIVTGTAKIKAIEVNLAVMDANFRMGSMGSVVGEKITLLTENALMRKLPLVIFTASGGARMQEGMFSLLQMAKTSAALKSYSDHGGLTIIVFTNPTTGGVSASFASLGDYHLAEKGAIIGFAGRRIIEQTIREKLPSNFQRSEFLLEHGQLDAVIHRHEVRKNIAHILALHKDSLFIRASKL